ncbi:MAG: hypothetical protein Harvfovirus43_9 [Harvfovirus sp.]|uniref:IPT/TIG domain-containing protein n=1 Tax=Harvfovirus sp. TaxID=2487768 RepID=A0A3G5A2X9_9VIRU|nr:MAG: hypothetical protein Harvfovirus43_9 [Harvfovirus sp.]
MNILIYATIFLLSLLLTGCSPPSTNITISPTMGPAGTTIVTIGNGGQNTLLNASSVTFNQVAVSNIVTNSDNSLSVIVPPFAPGGANPATVTVTLQTGNKVQSSNKFTYLFGPPPTLTSLSPPSGTTGTFVTITGTNFVSPATVTFNNVAGINTTVVSSTMITTTAPSNASGPAPVVVTTNGTSVGGLTFTYGPPVISGLSPTHGAIGTLVTIAGSNFSMTSTVTFQGTPATSVSFVNSTVLLATAPTNTQIVEAVIVSTNGVNSNSMLFTYDPIIAGSGISPAIGTIGTTVTITGSNFDTTTGATVVTFGGITATSTTNTANMITATAPTPTNTTAASTVNVVVTVNGNASNAESYEYATGLISIVPNMGSFPDPVVITGFGFSMVETTSVNFSNTEATPFTVVDANTIDTVVPNNISGGVKAVTVTTNGIQSNSVNFTVT